MLLSRRIVLVAFGLGVTAFAVACGGGIDTQASSTQTEVVVPIGETAPVRATIASASLGDRSANVQLAFFADEATAAATIEITEVVLIDATSGQAVETLVARSPQVWNGRSYEPWNEEVTPGGDLRASYSLSSPATFEGSSSYTTPYTLRITMRIEGAEVVLHSEELQREPPMVT